MSETFNLYVIIHEFQIMICYQNSHKKHMSHDIQNHPRQ